MEARKPRYSRTWRKFRWPFGLSLLLCLGLVIKTYCDTMRDPELHSLTVQSKHMTSGAPPIKLAFITDPHVAGPDMPPERLERIVEQVNALQPDLIAVTGDLISEKRLATAHYSAAEVVAPLASLEARYGVVFVPGNHDHWFDWPALRDELAAIPNMVILENSAAQVGPFAVAGLDDPSIGRDNMPATLAAMEGLEGIQLWLSHSPDTFPQIPLSADLVLAGHTHCGQIAYPWGGAPVILSEYKERYFCGAVEENGKTLITGSGLGTSVLPFRLFTQPDMWLITIEPK